MGQALSALQELRRGQILSETEPHLGSLLADIPPGSLQDNSPTQTAHYGRNSSGGILTTSKTEWHRTKPSGLESGKPAHQAEEAYPTPNHHYPSQLLPHHPQLSPSYHLPHPPYHQSHLPHQSYHLPHHQLHQSCHPE